MRSARTRSALALVALGSALGIACAALPSRPADPPPPPERIVLEDLSRRIERLERRRRFDPLGSELEIELGSAYFARAQRALESGDERAYLRDLEKAQTRFLSFMARNPRSSAAHNQLALVAAYRGDLEAARRGFTLAERLDRSNPVEPLNLAELAVYQDRLGNARAHLARAERLGAPAAEIALVEVLAAWKSGDLIDARDRFVAARERDPEAVRTWNGASRIESFDDFAAHCCRLAFCGPHLRSACQDMGRAVAEQERSEATILEELRLEMERVRRVREIYRELDVEVRTEEPETPDAPPAPPQSAPAP